MLEFTDHGSRFGSDEHDVETGTVGSGDVIEVQVHGLGVRGENVLRNE